MLGGVFGSDSDTDGVQQANARLRKVPSLHFVQNTYKLAYGSDGSVRCPREFTLHKTSCGKTQKQIKVMLSWHGMTRV